MSIANFLLIEEPEAHIHTHIQKTLFDKLNYSNTQVIYSTHSSHISEVSNIKCVNVIGKVDGKYQAFQPAFGLTLDQVGCVQRYLDAVRSNLLFAKSVILVEGDSEEILIPVLIKRVMGISLDELGISLVNIRSTGFQNVALLFHCDRIKKRCSIITDLDDTFFNTMELDDDSEAVRNAKKKALGSRDSGITRKIALDALCNDNKWLFPFYAPHTFEVDFVDAGNGENVANILRDIYTDEATIATSRDELMSDDISASGKRALTMAKNSGKGWFAILLGKAVDHHTTIPKYILDAVFFAHGRISNEVIFKVLAYRLTKIIDDLDANRDYVSATQGQPAKWYSDWQNHILARQESINEFKIELKNFKTGLLNYEQIRAVTLRRFPQDKINSVLASI